MKQNHWIIIFVMLLLAGCNTQTNTENNGLSQQDAAALIYTAAAMTAEADDTILQTETPQPEEADEDTPVPTEVPTYMVPVKVTLNGLILRSGPGTMFNPIATFATGTQVTTLGMVSDGTWIQVRAPLSGGGTVDGWMFAQYLDLSELEEALPVAEMSPGNTLSGTVQDSDGNPIHDVRVAAIIATDEGELRDESTTNHQGQFQIYYPIGIGDSARLEIVAVNCNSNIAEFVNQSCQVMDYFSTHWRETISLPQTEDLTFTYEKAITYLEGKVVYQDGNGASEILVRATRQSDGVQSEQVTPVGGAFRLPLGPGTWEVVAVRFHSDGTALLGDTRVYEVTSA
ncbi:MAG: SH3 domain-containing protein, partial [Anaerolineales bacterium]